MFLLSNFGIGSELRDFVQLSVVEDDDAVTKYLGSILTSSNIHPNIDMYGLNP